MNSGSSDKQHTAAGTSRVQAPHGHVPAGPILASEVGGPKCKIWDAIGSDLLAGGAGGARLADPRIGSGPTWPRAEHEAAKCAAPSPKIEPFPGGATTRRLPSGVKFPSRSTLRNAPFWHKGRVRPSYFLGF